MENEFDEMFSDAEPQGNDALQELAEQLAIKDDELARKKKEVSDLDAKVKAMKAQLCQAMIDQGIDKLSFDNGLSPSKAVKTKYYKAAGVDDETLQDWLKRAGLGDIIKPYVHFNTMQSALASYSETGHRLPSDIINQTEELSVRLNGKSKFLKNQGVTTE